MQIKSTVACVLALMAVASARPVVKSENDIQNEVQQELQQILEEEQLYGDISGATEKAFQSIIPSVQAEPQAEAKEDEEEYEIVYESVDEDAFLAEQEQARQAEENKEKACIVPQPPSSGSCYSSYGSSSYGPSCSDSYSSGSYYSSSGCNMPPMPCMTNMPAPCPAPNNYRPLPYPAPCPAPCPAPIPTPCMPNPYPAPCPAPYPAPCPGPVPTPFNPCFASPFCGDYEGDSDSCDISLSSTCDVSSSSSYQDVNINNYKFDVCGASVFGIAAQLRMIGLRFPNHPTSAQRTAFIDFITAMVDNFPCPQQQITMASYLKAHPINVNDRKSFNKWASAFARNALAATKFPFGLNLKGMLVPVARPVSKRSTRRATRK